jgi:hypothetical protein
MDRFQSLNVVQDLGEGQYKIQNFIINVNEIGVSNDKAGIFGSRRACI